MANSGVIRSVLLGRDIGPAAGCVGSSFVNQRTLCRGQAAGISLEGQDPSRRHLQSQGACFGSEVTVIACADSRRDASNSNGGKTFSKTYHSVCVLKNFLRRNFSSPTATGHPPPIELSQETFVTRPIDWALALQSLAQCAQHRRSDEVLPFCRQNGRAGG
jgi:hypothetical protein